MAAKQLNTMLMRFLHGRSEKHVPEGGTDVQHLMTCLGHHDHDAMELESQSQCAVKISGRLLALTRMADERDQKHCLVEVDRAVIITTSNAQIGKTCGTISTTIQSSSLAMVFNMRNVCYNRWRHGKNAKETRPTKFCCTLSFTVFGAMPSPGQRMIFPGRLAMGCVQSIFPSRLQKLQFSAYI